jgi:hypothetical protein
MLVDVPEPVWNTSSGNCASRRPSATSRAAASIAAASAGGSAPSFAFAAAAAAFTSPSARRNSRGKPSPLTGPFAIARCVAAPHSASAGTAISPRASRSIRVRRPSSDVVRTPDGRRPAARARGYPRPRRPTSARAPD